MKVFVDERGTDVIRSAVEDAEAVASADITSVELRATFARMVAGGRITKQTQRATVATFATFWADVAVIPTDGTVLERAATLTEHYALRGYDAVQLAAALELRDIPDAVFASWDDELNEAAEHEGLALI